MKPPAATPQTPRRPEVKLQPGDIYLDRGLLVFTAAYLLRRGYCCGSQCRHCPYRKSAVAT